MHYDDMSRQSYLPNTEQRTHHVIIARVQVSFVSGHLSCGSDSELQFLVWSKKKPSRAKSKQACAEIMPRLYINFASCVVHHTFV